MKITDLRIGNYVRSKRSGQIIQVYKVDSSPNHVGNVNNHLIIDFEPLPIDVEIFKRLGGVPSEYSPLILKIRVGRFCSLKHNGMECYISDTGSYLDVNIITGVHQLQNFYHAITGEELVLKMH